ncbi:MAG: DUF790 family protein [Pseudomonadota bacterium]
MPPAEIRCVQRVGDRLEPRLLAAADHPWLTALLGEYARFEGRSWGELRERMVEDLPCPSPPGPRAAAWAVLDRLGSRRPPVPGVVPRQLRLALALAAQRARDEETPWDRQAVLEEVGSSERLTPEQVERALFSDLPEEQIVVLPEPLPDAPTLALMVNLASVQALLRRALSVRLVLEGQARAVVRQAQLARLLCHVREEPGHAQGWEMEISGALALFRRTLLYGRRLAALVPMLQWCQRFELEARCLVDGREGIFTLATGAPIFPGPAPRTFDSKIEARFARDFSRLTTAWDILREPEPIQAGERLMFPDFALTSRADPGRRWLLEIVGFWTPAYLERKLEDLARAGRADLLLCIDEDLAVGQDDLPAGVPVLRFRKRVDAQAVLDVLEGRAAPAPASHPSGTWEDLTAHDLFLDYAGRRPASDPIHARLAALAPGQPLQLTAQGPWVLLADTSGAPLAALSRRAAERWRPRLGQVQAARLTAVLERRADQSAPAYRGLLRVARWRVPLAEVLDAGSG